MTYVTGLLIPLLFIADIILISMYIFSFVFKTNERLQNLTILETDLFNICRLFNVKHD